MALSSILFILRPKSSSQKKHLALSLSHITTSLVPCTFTFPSNIFPLSRVTNGQTELHGKMWIQVQCGCTKTHTHTHTHIYTHAHSQVHVFNMEDEQAKYWTKIGIFQAEWESVQGGQRVLNLLYFADIWIRNMDDWCKWLNIGNRNHLVVQLTSARRKVVRNLPSLVHLTPLAFGAKENLRKHCASNQH